MKRSSFAVYGVVGIQELQFRQRNPRGIRFVFARGREPSSLGSGAAKNPRVSLPADPFEQATEDPSQESRSSSLCVRATPAFILPVVGMRAVENLARILVFPRFS
jgi:hypothetical protein